MDDGFGAGVGITLFVLLIFVVGFLVGFVLANGSWSSDCEKLGQSRYGSKVYECRLKESK